MSDGSLRGLPPAPLADARRVSSQSCAFPDRAALMQTSRVLLKKTKLRPPRNYGQMTERPRLLSRLNLGGDRRIVLITAPAGSGKTTILVQAYNEAKARGLAVCWASLDEGDNDLVALVSLIVSALRESVPTACSATAILFETGLMPPVNVLQRTLLNEVMDLPSDTVLFVDDYHYLQDDAALDLMNALFGLSNARLQFCIATRKSENLSVARLEARGAIQEIEYRDLRFTDQETGELLRLWGHQGLTAEQTSTLCDRTEGWVAGLQLASIALAEQHDKADFIATFSGTNKRIDGFLSDEVFRRQPQAIQDFLLNTAILDRFTVGLCNAVNADPNNAQHLRVIELWNLFLFSLDNDRQWYRYHHLFGDYLRKKLVETFPERVPALHLAAARWCFDNGLVPEAIRHAFSSGDLDFAANLLDLGSDALFSAGRFSTLESFAQKLPAATLHRLPRVQLDRAWEWELRWNFADAEAALGDAREAIEAMRDEAGGAVAPSDLAYLNEKLAHREMMLKLLSDDVAGAREASRNWIAQRKSDDMFMYASALSARILTDGEHYCFDMVVSRPDEVRNLFLNHGALYGTVFHDSISARALQRCGRLDEATAILTRAREVAIRLHGDHTPLAAMPSVLLSAIAYERDDLATARALLDGNLPLTKELGFVDNIIAAFITKARLAALAREPAEVAAALDEADSAAALFGFTRLSGEVTLERVRLAASNPLFERLLDLTGLRQLPSDWQDPGQIRAPNTRHETAALVHCHLMMAEGAAAKAGRILQKWLSFTRAHHSLSSVARISALAARALAVQGDSLAGQRLLGDAFQLTAKAGYVRSYVDQGPLLLPLVQALHHQASQQSEGQLTAYLATIVGAMGGNPAGSDSAMIPGGGPLVEPLTGREVEILRLADEGLSNGEIADRLAIAESTVKWYWQRIFDKLDARGRRHAVRAVKARGLLQR